MAATRTPRLATHAHQDTLFALAPSERSTTPARPSRTAAPARKRPYQVEAIRDITGGLRVAGRGQLRAACGTGKTAMAQWAAEALVGQGGVVVIVCPTVGLVAQTLAAWKDDHPNHIALAVCGDDSVSAGEDAFGSIQDILEPVTTDPDVVDAWLRRPVTTALRLIVGTHVSAHVVGEGLQKAGISAALLVIDEAHRSAGAVDKHTALLHDDEVLPAARRLYMTATAKVVKPRGAAGAQDVLSMDDPAVFGRVLYSYPFSKAIADGWLDDYRVAVIGVTRKEVLAMLRRANARRSGPAPSEHIAMVQAATARAAAQLGLRRVIAFTPRVAEAAEFAATFDRTLATLPAELRPDRPLYSAHVHGKMNNAARGHVLEHLAEPPQDGWAVVANAKCLAEGVNIPAVDGIVFTAPKKSAIDIVQAVGRALRRDPDGSGVATIVVPILMADDADAKEIDAGDYEVLWQVIAALRAHDDTFAVALDTCRSTGFRDTTAVLDRIDFNMPPGYQTPDYLQHLTIRLVSSATTTWWEGFGFLRAYHVEHGDTLVHKDLIYNGFKLGQWVVQTRVSHQRGRLSPEQLAALNEIGFVVSVFDDRWEQIYAAAAEFFTEHGHLRPGHKQIIGGVVLATWLTSQRSDRRAGTLDAERIARLDRIGMDWDPHRSRWEANYAALCAYHAEHGNIDVPEGLTSSLGTPLASAVRVYLSQHREGTLAADRVAALEALGIVWSVSKDVARKSMIDTLAAYRAEHGDLLVPEDLCSPCGVNVQTWLVNQRRRRAQCEMTAEQIAELDALGMIWDNERLRWARTLSDLTRYHCTHGTINVAAADRKTDPAARSVYNVVSRMRGLYGKGGLPDFKIRDLTALGIEWNAAAARRASPDVDLRDVVGRTWYGIYEQLAAYQTEHGNLDLPDGHTGVNGERLESWLASQRSQHAKGKLAPERVALLDALGLSWRPERDNAWEQAAAMAERYFAAHGSIGLMKADYRTESGYHLYQWMRRQRKQADRGQLADDRLARLRPLGLLDQRPAPSRQRRTTAPTPPQPTAAQRWTDQLRDLTCCHASHGTINVAPAQDRDVAKLLHALRASRRKGGLDDAQIAALDALGMDWSPAQTRTSKPWAVARTYFAQHGHLRPSSADTDIDGVNLSAWVSQQRSRRNAGDLPEDDIADLTAMGIDWDPTTAGWTEGIAAATAFHTATGHLRVPPDYTCLDSTGEPFDLNGFVTRQRYRRKTGDLTQDRIAALDALDMDWDPSQTQWENKLSLLHAYRDEHSDLLPPRGHVVDGVDIGDLVRKYRRAYATGKLTAEQITALDALDMVWDPVERHWQQILAYLHAHYDEHGDIDIPFGVRTPPTVVNQFGVCPPDGIEVRKWLNEIRQRRNEGHLTNEQIAALDQVGMIWTRGGMWGAIWRKNLEMAEKFFRESGHLNVPSRRASQPSWLNDLYFWLSAQRQARANGKLTADQIAALDAMGMIWRIGRSRDAQWKRIFDEVSAFRAKHGHFDFRDSDGDATTMRRLSKWLWHQRDLREKGELLAEREEMLTGIGVDWRPDGDKAWDDAMVRLRAYCAACGDPNTLRSKYQCPDGFFLYQWLHANRQRAANGTLAPNRVKDLLDVGVRLATIVNLAVKE